MGQILDNIVGGLDAVNSLGNTVFGFLNYKNQKDNLDYQKDLQKQIFAREDTAIQRRVADLKAAGLSPTLAAGEGAGAGSVVSTNAPQMQDMNLSAGAILDYKSAVEDYNIKKAQVQNIKAMNEQIRAQTAKMQAETAGTLFGNNLNSLLYGADYVKDMKNYYHNRAESLYWDIAGRKTQNRLLVQQEDFNKWRQDYIKEKGYDPQFFMPDVFNKEFWSKLGLKVAPSTSFNFGLKLGG